MQNESFIQYFFSGKLIDHMRSVNFFILKKLFGYHILAAQVFISESLFLIAIFSKLHKKGALPLSWGKVPTRAGHSA